MSSVSKVVLGNQTIMDITDSTVNANNLLSGAKAYGSDGEPVLGAVNLSDKADQVSIANVENNATASQAYSVGEFFYRNGDFCVVTQAIASGATLTENTNYVVTDLASAIETALAGKLDNSQATLKDWMILERSTTTSADNSAILTFKTNDTTANVTNYSRVYAYSPHSGTGGNNLVINTLGKLYCGGGESPKNLYDNHKELGVSMTNEVAYFTSDSHLYVLANGNTITDAKGFILSNAHNITPYGFRTDVSPNAWGQLDNAGNIGTSSYRWASGNFVEFNATTLNGITIPTGRTGTLALTSDIPTDLSDLNKDISMVTYYDSGYSNDYFSIEANYWNGSQAVTNLTAIPDVRVEIAGINSGTTASQAYSRGDFFILSNKLCVASTDISSGGTLTEGTNYKVVKVTDYMTPKSGNITVNSDVSSWLSLTSNGSKCYRSGNHVKFIARFTITDMPSTYSSSPDILTLPWRAYRTASTEYQFYPIIVYSVPYPIYDNGSAWIYNRNSIRIGRNVIPNGTYTICGDYITDDPI